MSIRVLQVVTIMNRGGAETMIMNYYRNIDKNKVQFDFLVHREEKGVYEDEIEKLGGRIFRTNPIRPWNYRNYKLWLKKFFEEHNEFSAVHAHIQENSGFVLTAAKNAGISIRVSHSHTAPDKKDYKYLFRLYAKQYLLRSATNRFACGEKAGKWLYGNEQFLVLPNAVDVNLYSYDKSKRDLIREKLNINNKFVIGNVARFDYLKNHSFMVDVFNEYHKKNDNSILMLVGIGDKLQDIRKKVELLKLNDCVWFMNLRTDVQDLLQAMDAFLFPSILEGLPLSIIEAQASGLPCFISDIVTMEVGITDEARFLSLKDSAEQWADEILKVNIENRKNRTTQVCSSGYDIESNAKWLQHFYMSGKEA